MGAILHLPPATPMPAVTAVRTVGTQAYPAFDSEPFPVGLELALKIFINFSP